MNQSPQELRFRTLQGYGANGMLFTFPNGTTLSIKHDNDGKPHILIEGDAEIIQLRATSSRNREA